MLHHQLKTALGLYIHLYSQQKATAWYKLIIIIAVITKFILIHWRGCPSPQPTAWGPARGALWAPHRPHLHANKIWLFAPYSYFSLSLSVLPFSLYFIWAFLPEITLMMMVIQLSEIGPPKMQDWKWRTKPINGWKSMRQLQAYRKIDDQVIGGKRMFSMLHFSAL